MNGYQARVSWSPISARPVHDRPALLREALGPMRNVDVGTDAVSGFVGVGNDTVFVVWSSTNEIFAQTLGDPIRDVPDAAIERIGRLVLTFARGYTLTASRT
jgi:hypothetical protein